ncbi:MAG: prolipoprotein diacylglyceryl transferase, partial [Gammaproteobacteria bacterium]|nr:prolipoprotein diacylglyceryl transferase [Gammaproteobacteria bacterium]
MLIYPEIDPVLIQLGPVTIHWYGVMYLIAITLAWQLGVLRARSRPDIGFSAAQVGDLIFYGAVGLVLGGRIGYVLFYDLPAYIASPLNILKVWQGGMSFHGGLLGVFIAMGLYGRQCGKSFFAVTDFVAPLVPPGLGMGRLGNFINGELWGNTTDLPWGMVFPYAGSLPRHPSQLYEALLEGLALFIIVWLYSGRPRPPMAVSGVFLLGYGGFRFFVEFFRTPDAHLGYLAFGWLTMGQILTLPM